MKTKEDFDKFKELLDYEFTWPDQFLFKFIAPQDKLNELISIFKDNHITSKPSKTGKYTSITCHMMMNSSDEVIEIYKKAGSITGVISL
jgi:hypothetical protein